MSEMLGWWFGPADLVLPHGDGRRVVIGEALAVPPPLKLCSQGLHASERAIDGLCYAPARPAICRVRLHGEILRGDDKACATHRETLAIIPADEAAVPLRRFACWCVRHTPLHDGRMVWELLTDERSRHAVEVAEQYCDGLATDEELNAAWDAARDAARAAARDVQNIELERVLMAVIEGKGQGDE